MMPNLSNAVRRFEESLQFQIVQKTVVDGDLAEASKVKIPLFFEGTMQPLSPRELVVKSEGERKFKWWTLFSDMDLHLDWIVKDELGTSYRVMSSTDWRDASYRQYQLIEGPGL